MRSYSSPDPLLHSLLLLFISPSSVSLIMSAAAVAKPKRECSHTRTHTARRLCRWPVRVDSSGTAHTHSEGWWRSCVDPIHSFETHTHHHRLGGTSSTQWQALQPLEQLSFIHPPPSHSDRHPGDDAIHSTTSRTSTVAVRVSVRQASMPTRCGR